MIPSRPSIDQMAEAVLQWLYASPAKEQIDFLNCSKEDLSGYHHYMGRNIRNSFRLWSYPWEPEMKDGFDCSPEHPDAVSMRVIERVWILCSEHTD